MCAPRHAVHSGGGSGRARGETKGLRPRTEEIHFPKPNRKPKPSFYRMQSDHIPFDLRLSG